MRKSTKHDIMLIVILITSIILIPIITLWSANLLFGFGIELTFLSWVAVLWLLIILEPGIIGMRNNRDYK